MSYELSTVWLVTLALKHFSNQSALPNALFATWCVVTAAFLVEYWRKK